MTFSSPRRSAAALHCAEALGARREVADCAGSGNAVDDGLHEAGLVVGRDGPGQRAARGELDDRIHSIERAMPGRGQPPCPARGLSRMCRRWGRWRRMRALGR
jgi:hypothetical protein